MLPQRTCKEDKCDSFVHFLYSPKDELAQIKLNQNEIYLNHDSFLRLRIQIHFLETKPRQNERLKLALRCSPFMAIFK